MIEMKILRIFTFPGCVVNIDYTGNYVETIFPDGTKVPATPNYSELDTALAHKLGYNGDTAKMTREHEFLHTFLAVKMGQDYSTTLWDVAHQQNLGQGLHWQEERRVLAFQQVMNNVEDIEEGGFFDLLPYGIDDMREEATRLLR